VERARVERLTLRLAGWPVTGEGDARRLARLVAEGMAGAPTPRAGGRVGEVRARVSGGTSEPEDLARAIVEAVLRELDEA
jgi:hypothetical protein